MVGWGAGVVHGIFSFLTNHCCNNIVGLFHLAWIAGFIMLHVYRFQAPGQFCTGHYNPPDWSNAPLKSKGGFLLGYMITIWCGIGCFICIFVCVVLAHKSQ